MNTFLDERTNEILCRSATLSMPTQNTQTETETDTETDTTHPSTNTRMHTIFVVFVQMNDLHCEKKQKTENEETTKNPNLKMKIQVFHV